MMMHNLLLQLGLNHMHIGSMVTSIVLFSKLMENLVLVSIFERALDILSKHTPRYFPLLQLRPSVKLSLYKKPSKLL